MMTQADQGATLAAPGIDFSEFGETKTVELSKLQVLAAGFLWRSWATVPHVTYHDEVDVTGMEVARRAWNTVNPEAKLTSLVLIIKAVVSALRMYPRFNASLDAGGRSLVLKHYFNIGIAVDTPKGLLVPVIRGCDYKSIHEIAAELTAVAHKARSKYLSMAEMSGGCITISSLGHIGGTMFTPIINAPEVAILGITRNVRRPIETEQAGIAWREMVPLSLSYDHRVINGVDAAQFLRHIGAALAEANDWLRHDKPTE